MVNVGDLSNFRNACQGAGAGKVLVDRGVSDCDVLCIVYYEVQCIQWAYFVRQELPARRPGGRLRNVTDHFQLAERFLCFTDSANKGARPCGE
jgi:hypothetical protein